MAKLLILAVLISCIALTLGQSYADNLEKLNRSKRSIFGDILAGIKITGRKAVEIDRDVRQAVQTKAIQLLKDGRFGTYGELAAPAAQKVKELWDEYDAFKLKLLA